MKAGQWGRGLAAAGTLLLLWAPLGVLALHSFNASRFSAQWEGFTLQWHRAAWRHDAALAAVRTSVALALTSAAISTVLGTPLGYALARWRFRGRDRIQDILRAPMMTPDIVFAVGLVLLFALLRQVSGLFELGLGAMILGHVAFQIPFVAVVVQARAAGFDRQLEEAARDLGATAAQTFRHVTAPMLRPGVIAAAALAFTLSLDDFAVSFFTGGPGSTTLPVFIYASARRGISPEIHALSTALVAVTVAIVMLGWRFGSKRE